MLDFTRIVITVYSILDVHGWFMPFFVMVKIPYEWDGNDSVRYNRVASTQTMWLGDDVLAQSS